MLAAAAARLAWRRRGPPHAAALAAAVRGAASALPQSLDDPPAPAPPPTYPPLDLAASSAYASVPSGELLRSAAVLGACAAAAPVAHRADALLDAARRVLGKSIIDGAVERTLYAHFCAGPTARAAATTVAPRLAARGVRSILNYSAESATSGERASGRGGGVEEEEGGGPSLAALQDARLAAFLDSVAWTDTSPALAPGIVAVKVTALLSADVLERASAALVASSRGGWGADDDAAATARAALSGADAAEWDAGWGRLVTLFEAAREKEGPMRVIIDAEQTWLQPAIDALALQAARRYNVPAPWPSPPPSSSPLILNTYQCYLTSAPARLARDAARARAEGWTLGAKPVRGAYLVSERARARAAGAPSPCHPSIDATHACYDATVARCLDAVGAGRAELMVASHNAASVRGAAAGAAVRGVDRAAAPLYFGQLKGMADATTLALAAAGYKAYKICATGPLADTMGFLVRRAQENGAALSTAGSQARGAAREVVRRVVGW